MVYKGMTGWKISLPVSETKTVLIVVLQDFLNVLQKVIWKQYFIFLKKIKINKKSGLQSNVHLSNGMLSCCVMGIVRSSFSGKLL